MAGLINNKKSYNYNKKFYNNALVPTEGAEMTKYFEGFKKDLYKDTKGVQTIGYGFNVNAMKDLLPLEVIQGKRSLTKVEASSIFDIAYSRAKEKAVEFATPQIFQSLTPAQQNILTDMSYNLGGKLFKFKNMQNALLNKDFNGVVREMQDSSWYEQVGRRSKYHVDNFNLSQEAIAQSKPVVQSETQTNAMKNFEHQEALAPIKGGL